MEKYGYIYLTTNLINNKKYIGQHKSKKFDKNYYGSGVHFESALKKYGKKNFRIEILQWCYSIEELNEQEIYFISKFNAVENKEFYNIQKGGKNSPCSEETKKKISLANSGEKNGMFGKKLSESAKTQIKEKHIERADLIGKQFGLLTVIENVENKNKKRGLKWLCECECGEKIIASTNDLKSGKRKCCSKRRHFGKKKGDHLKAGQKIGSLTLLKRVPGSKWLCECECGTIKEYYTSNLSTGKTKSCGCKKFEKKPRIDLIGKQFGLLTVIEDKGHNAHGNRIWLCKCKCGGEKIVCTHSLVAGLTKSCGCLQKEAARNSCKQRKKGE